MEKILISACLLGQKVRYDGGENLQKHPVFQEWIKAGRVVSICPEVAGGLSIPRPPAEIQAADGTDVIHRRAVVLTNEGSDVTAQFIAGAHKTLELAKNTTPKSLYSRLAALPVGRQKFTMEAFQSNGR